METKRLISDCLNRIRLLTVKQKEPYLLFRRILGFYPRKIDWYELALRHKSQSLHQEDGIVLNNERLEFLGDAILNVLVADLLFIQFPEKNEDFLTKTRSRIVQRNSLNKIALELGLDKLIVAIAPSDSVHHSIYGNALEALIGAIYLDRGYRQCKHFLEKTILERYVDIERIASTDLNFKSALLEWSQHERLSLSFETTDLSVKGQGQPKFTAKAVVNGHELGEGIGPSKKEAQQRAAKEALKIIHEDNHILTVLLQEEVQKETSLEIKGTTD